MSDVVLTPTQRKVFDQLIEGKSNKEIANVLGRAEASVCRHVKALLTKFNCDRRCKLIVKHYKGLL